MDFISTAIAQTEASLKQFKHEYTFVPAEKLNWSPAPSAKSPMKILAHVTNAATFFARMIEGKSSTATPEQAMQQMATAEAELTNRDEAFKLLDEATANAIAAMKALTPEDLGKIVKSPLRDAPISFWVTLYYRHLDMHAAQVEYLQTCWGDTEFHPAR